MTHKSLFLRIFSFLVCIAFLTSSPLMGAEKKAEAKSGASGMPISFYYKDGLKWKTENGDFSGQIGGRIMWDLFWGREPNSIRNVFGEFRDGTEFRRVRFFMKGKVYKNIGYKLQFDWANSGVALKDAYIAFHFPSLEKLLNIQLGHFKRPQGLEEYGTSSKYITFIERSLANAFAPERDAGIMVYGNPHKMLGYALGIFKQVPDISNSNTGNPALIRIRSGTFQDEGDYSFSGRFYLNPMYDEKKGRAIHAGFSYSFTPNINNVVVGANANTIFTRPEAHLAPTLFSTGALNIGGNTDANIFGIEFAAVFGPVSLQGEYFSALLDTPRAFSKDPSVWGYYVFVSFFVTGEHRNYNPKKGGFGRVRPKKNFMQDGGFGALEVALRFSSIDLDSHSVGFKAEGYDITFGANWYLTPNVRFMINYIYGWKAGKTAGAGGGSYDIILTRFQIDF